MLAFVAKLKTIQWDMATIWSSVISALPKSPILARTEVEAVFSGWGVVAPDDYVDVLVRVNGCRILIGERHLRLYSLNEMTTFRRDYGFDRYFSETLIFGSDGVGGVYSFDATSQEPRIWDTMFVPYTKEGAELRGRNLRELVTAIGEAVNSDDGARVIAPGSNREWHARAPLAHGGSPTEPSNWVEIEVPSPGHAKICRFWNDVWLEKGG